MSTTDVTTTDALVSRFADPAGFKKYIGMLGGKRAKASHALFSGADERGAARSYLLDTREHDDAYYYIRAISVRGDLDEATLAELTRAATLLPLGTIRYEGMMAPTLPDAVGSSGEATDVHDLSNLEAGVIVYPVTELSKKGLSNFALWARSGTEWFVYPIEDKKL
jgi:hypothetical protein